MAIKIKDIYSYTLSYDARRKEFLVEDTDGTELATAPTQNEAEVKAKALSKQEFKRISIFEISPDGKVTMGELTSVNRDDKSAWVSMEKAPHTWGSGRQKINLYYDRGRYYEASEANLKTLESIKTKHEELQVKQNEIDILIKSLERPINQEYFGIKE